MQNNYIISFKKLNKNSISKAGGKGASLGEMLEHGFSVPDGFVISAKAFEKYMEDSNINIEIKKYLDKRPMDVEWALEKNKLYILQARPITTLNT